MPFKIGQIVSHNEIIEEFKCGNMGGMRRSLATNSLILISDHTKTCMKINGLETSCITPVWVKMVTKVSNSCKTGL